MKTISKINTATPKNNTIKLSLAAARHLVGDNVKDVLESTNNVPLHEFASKENRTLILGEMLGVSKENLGAMTLGETLHELGLDSKNPISDSNYKGNIVMLGGTKKIA